MKNTEKKVHVIKKTVIVLLTAVLCIALGTAAFYGAKGYMLYRQAAEERTLDERVRDAREDEDYAVYSELPEFYVNAPGSVEDHRFREHGGIDVISIARAAWTDIKAWSFEEGGSTITQQLVKNLMFTKEKKMERKAAEAFATLEMESKYTKDEIFELYANIVDFGSGYKGIREASAGYFGKEPSELTDYECAMLAGIPNLPSEYSPDVNKKLAEKRVSHVLKSMERRGMITQEEAEEIEDNNF